LAISRRAVKISLSGEDTVERTSLLSQWKDNTFQLRAPMTGTVYVRCEMTARERSKKIQPG
jgi:ribosomal protein L21